MKIKVQRSRIGELDPSAAAEAYRLEQARKLLEESGFVPDPTRPGSYIPDPANSDPEERPWRADAH